MDSDYQRQLGKYFDGKTSEATELEEALRSDAGALEEFVATARLASALEDELQLACSSAQTAAWLESLVEEAENKAPANVIAAPRRAWAGLPGWAWGIAASVVAVMMLAAADAPVLDHALGLLGFEKYEQRYRDRQELKIFDRYDRDGNGAMSFEEFDGLYGGRAVRFQSMFQKHSGNDEELSMSEFQALRAAIRNGAGSGERPPGKLQFERSRAGKMFAAYDENGDGKVTRAEYLQMFEGPGQHPARERQFNESDQNGDDVLDRDEFVNWLNRKSGGKEK